MRTMLRMVRYWLFAGGIGSFMASCNGSADTALNIADLPNGTGFNKKTSAHPAGNIAGVSVFMPKSWQSPNGVTHLMIVFLHGIGEAERFEGAEDLTVGRSAVCGGPDRHDYFDFFCPYPANRPGAGLKDACADVIAAIHEVANGVIRWMRDCGIADGALDGRVWDVCHRGEVQQ